jgi:hypothetical protein
MRLQEIQFKKIRPLLWPNSRQAGICAGLVVVAIIPLVGEALLQNSPRNVPEFINRLPDVNDQEKMRQQKGQLGLEAANADRKKQVSEDSAKLLKLATDLKAEIEKTGNNPLAVSAIRKTGAIEKLARTIRERMTLSVRSN